MSQYKGFSEDKEEKFNQMCRHKQPIKRGKRVVPTPPPQYLDAAAFEELTLVLSPEQSEQIVKYCEDPPDLPEDIGSVIAQQ